MVAHADAAESVAWRLIVALGVTQIVAWGSVYYLFALLMEPLQQALAADKQQVVGAFSLALLVSGLATPWVGRTIDRVGGRSVMTAGSLGAALLLAVLSRVETLAALYATWLGLGLAMAATLYAPAFAVLTQAHPVRYRAAIGTLTLFGGFASTVFWPLTALLIGHLGWRDALLVLAAINLLVCVPLHAWLLPPPPADRAVGDGDIGARDPAARDVLRTRPFIALAACFVGQSLVVSAIGVHLIALLAARGLSPAAAAGIAALVGPMQVLGRVVEMSVARRVSAATAGRVAALCFPLGLLALWLAPQAPWLVLVFALFYGAGNGVMTIVRGAVPAELFGRTHYGAISGALAAPGMLAGAFAPLLASLLWAAFGDYERVLAALALLSAAAAAAFFVATARRA